MRLLHLYEASLKRRPKTTNAIMTGALFGIGDVSAQLLFPTSKIDKGYDYKRTARAVVYGSLIFSFIGDKWYKILNNRIYMGNKPQYHWSNMVLRVAVDQLAFAPLGLPFYFTCMSIMEGRSFDVAKLKIKEQWWPTLLTNWAVWPVFQAVNFSVVPLQHRLLAVNVVAIFWNTYLSYKNSKVTEEYKVPVHYPPVVE